LPEIECVVDGSITLLSPHPKVHERLRVELSLPNPEFTRAVIRKAPTADIDPRRHATVELPSGLRVPRGAVAIVRKVIEEEGHSVRLTDQRSLGDPIFVPKREYALRDYQAEGSEGLVKTLQGLVVLPCGGGKTMLGAACIAEVSRTALVVVHTSDLLDQWVETIDEKLGIKAGVIHRGKTHLRGVTVAVINTLNALLSELPSVGRSWGLVIVDEAHRVPAAMLQSALARLPGRWRVGLTATPDREDGLGSWVDWSFGPRLTERSAQQLVDRGWLTMPTVEAVESRFKFNWQGPDKRRLAALTEAIVGDEERNTLIVRLVAKTQSIGQSALVLSNHVEHCNLLAAKIGREALAVTSKTPRAERRTAFEDFRSGKLPVMVSTQLAHEGVDVPRLGAIVLALPERAKSRTIQKTGRLMRNFPGKKPVLYDVVDHDDETLYSRWKARRATYKKIGIEVRETCQ